MSRYALRVARHVLFSAHLISDFSAAHVEDAGVRDVATAVVTQRAVNEFTVTVTMQMDAHNC